MLKTGAGILLDGLAEQGVTTVFGYPGAAVLSVYDELYTSAVQHVLVRHEQAAAHAADGYARASGMTGVCLATSGPGALQLWSRGCTAHRDSVPMVALTGQVPSTSLGLDAFQEADIMGITPITKCNYLVRRTEDAATVREALPSAGRDDAAGPPTCRGTSSRGRVRPAAGRPCGASSRSSGGTGTFQIARAVAALAAASGRSSAGGGVGLRGRRPNSSPLRRPASSR